MTKGTLPPQAYTREMLTQAYQWMQTQPESIRKLADSADALVGLYLRARRGGDANLESVAPVSTENFRANLKTIAAELQQFAGTAGSQEIVREPSIKSFEFDEASIEPFILPDVEARIAPTSTSPTLAQAAAKAKTATSLPTPMTSLDHLDSRSRAAVQKAQQKLNLSSENEALRALIALGYDHLEKL